MPPTTAPARDPLVTAEEVFVAENVGKRVRRTERLATTEAGPHGEQIIRPVTDDDGTMIDVGRTRVTHTSDELVRMWKPTAAGWRVKRVPSGNILLNIRNGWKTLCPDCGTDCGDDPNDCPAQPPAPVAYCPKIGCNHRINLRNLALDRQAPTEADPNAIDLGYGEVDERAMLKAAMDQHIVTRHQREARLLLKLRPDAPLQPNTF